MRGEGATTRLERKRMLSDESEPLARSHKKKGGRKKAPESVDFWGRRREEEKKKWGGEKLDSELSHTVSHLYKKKTVVSDAP